jgi:hypothetical protein
MKRSPLVFVILLLLLASLACQTLLPGRAGPALPAASTAAVPAATLPPSPEAAQASPTAAPAATTPAATQASLGAENRQMAQSPEKLLEAGEFTVRLHPEDGLYVGDLVSFEVIAPPGADLDEQELAVQTGGQILGTTKFGPFGIGGRAQATLLWAWDTGGLEPGTYPLVFEIQPSGLTWEQEVTLQHASAMPPPGQAAHWQTTTSDCCRVYTISGTAAARDLPDLLPLIDAQAEQAIAAFGLEFSEPIEIVLLPRVLGHGGFASGEIAVSYLDRNYANNDLAQVLHHEMVHILDRRLGGTYQPTIFLEGLAVYLSGGHYKREPLLRRAAALPELGLYLPLEGLVNDFYNSQHEIGYLQAGALVQFIVDEWGWQAFDTFYRSIPQPQDGDEAGAVDQALQANFGLSLGQLEARFLAELHRQTLNPDLEDDVRLTVRLYDTVRRYQQALDPSAYFLTAWLLSGPEMRSRDVVADYLRHPNSKENQALEALFVAAGDALKAGRYPEAQRLLAAAERTLDALEAGVSQPFSADPLAEELLRLAQRAAADGFELQRVVIEDGMARVWATAQSADPGGPKLVVLNGLKIGGDWVLQRSY